ncbi:hypothetical protein Vretifemale_18590, partial [Volvox reticuliferus]
PQPAASPPQPNPSPPPRPQPPLRGPPAPRSSPPPPPSPSPPRPTPRNLSPSPPPSPLPPPSPPPPSPTPPSPRAQTPPSPTPPSPHPHPPNPPSPSPPPPRPQPPSPISPSPSHPLPPPRPFPPHPPPPPSPSPFPHSPPNPLTPSPSPTYLSSPSPSPSSVAPSSSLQTPPRSALPLPPSPPSGGETSSIVRTVSVPTVPTEQQVAALKYLFESSYAANGSSGPVSVNVTILAKTITVSYSIQTLNGGVAACPTCNKVLLDQLRGGVATAARALLGNTATECGASSTTETLSGRRRQSLALAAPPPPVPTSCPDAAFIARIYVNPSDDLQALISAILWNNVPAPAPQLRVPLPLPQQLQVSTQLLLKITTGNGSKGFSSSGGNNSSNSPGGSNNSEDVASAILADTQGVAAKVARVLNLAKETVAVEDPEASGQALISPAPNNAVTTTITGEGNAASGDDGPRSSDISTGAVVGIVLGLVGGAVLLWAALYFARLGRRRSGMHATDDLTDGIDPRVIMWQNTCAEAAVARGGGPQKNHYPTLAQMQHVIAVPEAPRRKRMANLKVDMVANTNQFAM